MAPNQMPKPWPIVDSESPMESMECDGLVAVCTFRYALGRRTYVVTHVADWLIANRDKLGQRNKDLIVREIDEQDQRWGLGDDCDRRDWLRVREAMQ